MEIINWLILKMEKKNPKFLIVEKYIKFAILPILSVQYTKCCITSLQNSFHFAKQKINF